jgi:hypothetical protein
LIETPIACVPGLVISFVLFLSAILPPPFVFHIYFVSGGDLKVPYGKGVVGSVAATKDVILLNNPAENGSFCDLNFDEDLGIKTRNLLCVPILDLDGEVCGVLKVSNTVEADRSFNETDKLLLQSLAHQIAVRLITCLYMFFLFVEVNFFRFPKMKQILFFCDVTVFICRCCSITTH